jgi:L-fuculose-phosphate aldolase
MPDLLTRDMLPEFRLAGEALLACRCNNSHSGNLSIRCGDRIVITRTGAMLANLDAGDLVVTSRLPTPSERERASSELAVHLNIYSTTGCRAIAHGHALAAVAVAWTTDRIKLIDVEGAYYFGSVPVLEHVPATADPALGEAVAAVLATEPIVILRGHGAFAAADSLEVAMQRIVSVNDSAELIIKAVQLGLDVEQLAQAPYLNSPRVAK